MNKTIEALKLAEEALVKANHFHDYEDALAAIREALADQFPDATKMMDEPVAMMNSVGNTEAYRRTEQQTKGFDIPLYAAPVQPVKQEPVDFDEWMKNPYTIVLQKSIREYYIPATDAKAIRAEALEEAAKVCDRTAKDCPLNAYKTIRDCAAAIRGLK